MKNIEQRQRRLEQGQSLIEMSIGMVVILLMVSGLLDLGRLYFIQIAMEDSVAEATLYLSIYPDCRNAFDGPQCADPNNAEFRARSSSSGNLDWSLAQITIDRPSVYGVGDPVSVTMTYDFALLTPIIPRIVGINPIPLTTKTTQIIISE